jgi:hypothetical protein
MTRKISFSEDTNFGQNINHYPQQISTNSLPNEDIEAAKDGTYLKSSKFDPKLWNKKRSKKVFIFYQKTKNFYDLI